MISLTERYYLIFWPAEGKVSIHKDVMEVKKAGNIGDTVPVLFFGKKQLYGRVVGIGK